MADSTTPPDPLRLILIDDHDSARSALERRLAADARVAVVASTARLPEALSAIARHAPHAALIDHRRQDGDGLYIVAQVDAVPRSHRPLVALHSAFLDTAEWMRARQAGADDWFLKQIGAEALVERLVEAVRRCLPPERWQSIA